MYYKTLFYGDCGQDVGHLYSNDSFTLDEVKESAQKIVDMTAGHDAMSFEVLEMNEKSVAHN